MFSQHSVKPLSSYLFMAYSPLGICLSSSESGQWTPSCKFAKWWKHFEVMAFFSHLFHLRYFVCNFCQKWKCKKASLPRLCDHAVCRRWPCLAAWAQLFLPTCLREGCFCFRVFTEFCFAFSLGLLCRLFLFQLRPVFFIVVAQASGSPAVPLKVGMWGEGRKGGEVRVSGAQRPGDLASGEEAG